MNTHHLLRPGIAAAATMLVIASVGCSVATEPDEGANASEQVSAVPALVERVPADIAAAGLLRVATDPTYPPFGTVDSDGKTIIGFDADMAHAVGGVLGLDVEMVSTSFDAIIPALDSQKVDMALSSIGDTKEREQVISFATYYWGGGLYLVPAGNPKEISPDTTCGLRIGVNRGSLQQTTFLPDKAALCEAAGEAPPTVEAYQGNQAQLALQANRIDAIMLDAPAAESIAAKSDGSLEAVGPLTKNPNPGGIAFRKDSELPELVSDAVDELIASGFYAETLDKWGLSAIAIDASQVNGAQS